MSIEKKMIRSDIPGHQTLLAGSSAEEACRLVVGRDISLCGSISSCDHLLVEGVVEAESFMARRMDILETGLFAGMAEVQDAVIAGRFEGRLVVHGKLTVKATGRVMGEITYGAIEAEAGSRIEGHVAVLPPPAAVQPIPVVEQPAPVVVPEPANDTVPPDVESYEETQEERPRLFRRAVGH